MAAATPDDPLAIFADLLANLGEVCRLAARDAAEGRGDLAEKRALRFELGLRAARSAAERLAASEGAPERAREEARRLVEAHEAFAKQTVSAKTHLAELAEGWRCARCSAAAPKLAKLPPMPGEALPVLECRACGAESPLTAAGAAAYERLFGHLRRAPVWNPEANGFGRLR